MAGNFWDGFFGHEKARQMFELLVQNNKIPSGIILSGPAGIGADFLALKFSHLLKLSKDSKVPDKDTIPYRFEEPDIKYIYPLMRGLNEDSNEDPFQRLKKDDIDEIKKEISYKNINPYHEFLLPRANEIKLNSIRSIKNFLSLNYSDYAYRTILISKAEYMSDTTQNALLKSLEEPPPGVTMILTTTDSSKLLTTIRSRCWEIKLNHLSDAEMTEILERYFETDKSVIKNILPFAKGNLNEAVNLMDADVTEIATQGIEILRFAMSGNFLKASAVSDVLFKEKDNEKLNLFIRFLINWFSDAFKHSMGREDYILTEHAETFRKFAERYPETKYSEILNSLENLQTTLENNYMNKAGIISKIFYELRAVTTAQIKLSTP